MRVKAALWVAAYVRRVNATGDAFAVVAKKGAEEAGAILIRIDRPDRTGQLYIPAPQSFYDDAPSDRLFVARWSQPVATETIDEAVAREIRLDPDIWIVAVDDRDGRHFLGEALSAS